MAYVAPVLRTNANPPRSNFEGLVADGNRIGMTGVLGSNLQTQDATTSPVNSPATVNTATTLTVPANAAQCTIVSTTNAVRVSETPDSTTYFAVPAAVPFTFDCARMSAIYLTAASSTAVSFAFNVV